MAKGFFLIAALGCLLGYGVAVAAYPEKPIRLIVPVGPGGGLDRVARGVVARLGDSLGQTVVVDNRAGAGGDIGTGVAVKAAPDGYTVLMVSANFTVRASMYKVPYDPVRDFEPITQVATVPLLLVVHPSVPAKTVTELVAYAKTHAGKLNYSTPGNGSLVHLAGELFKSSSDFAMTHVAYKGVAAAFTDLLAGRVQTTFTGLLTARPHVQAGKLRGLAVTSRARARTEPQYPTMIEAGVRDFEATQWHGLLLPKGTPAGIAELLNREMLKILRQPEMASRMANDATEPVGSSRAQFARFMLDELKKWQQVIQRAGIKGE